MMRLSTPSRLRLSTARFQPSAPADDLQQVVQSARMRDEVVQQMAQERALLRHTRGRAQIEGRARRQADEVHLVGVESRLVAAIVGEQRHAGRQGQAPDARGHSGG